MFKAAITARLAAAIEKLEAINHMGWTMAIVPAQYANQQAALLITVERCQRILARR